MQTADGSAAPLRMCRPRLLPSAMFNFVVNADCSDWTDYYLIILRPVLRGFSAEGNTGPVLLNRLPKML